MTQSSSTFKSHLESSFPFVSPPSNEFEQILGSVFAVNEETSDGTGSRIKVLKWKIVSFLRW